MKVLVNAVSAKLGGAATYVHNLVRSLAAQPASGDEFVFVVPPASAARLTAVAGAGPVRILPSDAAAGSYLRRAWFEQIAIRGLVRRERPDVLFSSANFSLLVCPCPQVLLVRIPIYFSREYLAHVLPQKSAAFRAETALRRWLVCRSVRAADWLMTPSAAMLDDLRAFARVDPARAVVNSYGVPASRLTDAARVRPSPGAPLRILWVSHYADHKDLATLLDAAGRLRAAGAPPFELHLTLDPLAVNGQHTPMPAQERRLLAELAGVVRPLGVCSYEETWALYAQADIFVFPSLCESFGHPLVEAMASGLPVVASDIAVHREVCADAAAYFPVRDTATLAGVLRPLLDDADARRNLAARARARATSFLWEDHVARLLALLRRASAG